MPSFVSEDDHGRRVIVTVPGRKHTPNSLERMADQMVENWARGHVGDDPESVFYWANHYRKQAREMRAAQNQDMRDDK